jgi:hypothetical protein
MPVEGKPRQAIDLNHLGARKIQDFVAEEPDEPIDLSHLGGKRVLQHTVPENSKV